MSVDYKRVVEAAVTAAFDGDHGGTITEPRKHGSGVKTVAAGAALVAVARVAVKKAPDMVHLPKIGDLTDRVRDRLTESGWLGDDEDDDDFDVEDEADLEDEDDEEDDADEEDEDAEEDGGDLEDEADVDEDDDEADVEDEADDDDQDEADEDIDDEADDDLED